MQNHVKELEPRLVYIIEQCEITERKTSKRKKNNFKKAVTYKRKSFVEKQTNIL